MADDISICGSITDRTAEAVRWGYSRNKVNEWRKSLRRAGHMTRTSAWRDHWWHDNQRPPSAMAGNGNHCSFVLLAEFHILEGAQLKYQFPQPLGVDEGYVSLPTALLSAILNPV